MYTLSYYFLLFLIYSVIGWLMECSLVFITQRKLTNRGFLIGPYCPIYGVAGVIMTICFSKLKDNIPLLFISTILFASFLEYFTSFFMEKLFKARWWDYSTKKFNLQGRICLQNCIAFGVLGVIAIQYINPILIKSLNYNSHTALIFYASCFFFIFITDFGVSFCIMNKIKETITIALKEDSTVEMTNKVIDTLKKKKLYLSKRILKAFPSIKIIPIKKQLTKRRKGTK